MRRGHGWTSPTTLVSSIGATIGSATLGATVSPTVVRAAQ